MEMQMSSSSSSTSVNSFSPPPDHLPPSPSPSDQLCYVHCNYCDTVLAVSVPCSSLFKTVTVRCGHCTNLLSVNMRSHLLPSPNHFHPFFTSPPHYNHLLDEIRNGAPPNMLMNNQSGHVSDNMMMMMPAAVRHGPLDDLPKPPLINRPPEKRQRVPSAYNRFIKDEIQRIKAGNPDISHREAFSAAAKNWAHFPHIHFGLMPDHQPVKKTNIRQQEGGDHEVMMKDGLFAPVAANVGMTPANF